MSSSNLVSLKYITEASYGVTPGSGTFKTVRFTSEKLSGTPGTAESQQIRTDRLSSGQIVTSLSVGGDISFELAKESPLDDFMESAMLSTWQTFSPISVDLTIDATAKTLTRASGSWPGTMKKGDIITLGAFTHPENNVPVMVTALTSSTVISYVGPVDMISEVATGTTFEQNDKLTIGTTKKSFSFEKSFEDLTTKAIIYKGMLVSNMNLSVAHGSIITGSFSFSGNHYDTVSAAADFITYTRTVTAAATTQSMNGSVDMPFIATSAVGALDAAGFCIQKVDITLDNQFTTQNCIGEVAPTGYSAGTAKLEVGLSAYLSNENWDILGKKLSQQSFEVGFMVKNADGWYGFYMPAVQVSFDDPSSGGQNQDVILDMKGTGKVGATGESSITIFRS